MCQSVFKYLTTKLKIQYGQPYAIKETIWPAMCQSVLKPQSSYYIEETIWPAMCQSVFKHQVTTLEIQYGHPCAKVYLNIKLLH